MDILNNLLRILNEVPEEVWLIVAETIVVALIASPLVVGLKKWLSINSEKVMLVTTILASMAGAAGAYAINDPVFSAAWLPVHGWLIFATTQPIYRFLVKPIIRKIQATIAEAVAFNNEIKSAAVPPAGLPHSHQE